VETIGVRKSAAANEAVELSIGSRERFMESGG